MSEIRLQKYIAEAGIASRRKAEELILQERVQINGKVVTELGIKVEYKKVYKVLISSQVVKLKTKCLLTFAGILPMFYYKCFGVN